MLMLDLHLYFGGIKCFIGLEESGKTTHISHSDDFLLAVMAAVCFGRDSGCVFRCLWEGLVHSLHDCTAAICNGGSKSHYLQLF